MEFATEKYLETNREKLKDFAGSQLFFSWAALALAQGAKPETVFYRVFEYNLGGK